MEKYKIQIGSRVRYKYLEGVVTYTDYEHYHVRVRGYKSSKSSCIHCDVKLEHDESTFYHRKLELIHCLQTIKSIIKRGTV